MASQAVAMGPGAGPTPFDPVHERVVQLVKTSDRFRSPLALEDFVRLLPADGPSDSDSLLGWIRDHPGIIGVDGRWAGSPLRLLEGDEPERRERARRYLRRAGDRFATYPPGQSEWVRFVGVTGSVAYGDARPNDDCDLMAIVRPGTLWLYLAASFVRFRRWRSMDRGSTDPPWCLNYVLDERVAEAQYGRPQGFAFAREALTVQAVFGASYYRALLDRSPWLAEEIPRMYSRWGEDFDRRPATGALVGPGTRVLNAVVFPWLAAYLQLKGLRANHRLRRRGQADHCFRTLTRLSRMALETQKFDRHRA